MDIYMDSAIEQKLARRGISLTDIIEAFANRERSFLRDDREEHRTNPPTMWFCSNTNKQRPLKVVFLADFTTGEIRIKSAYEPTNPELFEFMNDQRGCDENH